jgi:hypothetical protein
LRVLGFGAGFAAAVADFVARAGFAGRGSGLPSSLSLKR